MQHTSERQRFIESIIKEMKISDSSTDAVPHIMREFILDDAYGLSKMKTIPHVIIDAGAHVGIFSILCSKLWPDSRIIALEPFSKNYNNLIKNIEANKCTNITPHKIALGATSDVELFLGAPFENSGGTSISFSNTTTERVQTITLDKLINDRYIDFLKMDIERSEYQVLHDFTKWRCIKYLAIEYHRPFIMPGYNNQMQQALMQTFHKWVKANCDAEGISLWTNDITKL